MRRPHFALANQLGDAEGEAGNHTPDLAPPRLNPRMPRPAESLRWINTATRVVPGPCPGQ